MTEARELNLLLVEKVHHTGHSHTGHNLLMKGGNAVLIPLILGSIIYMLLSLPH